MEKTSILEMGQGAFLEQVDKEMERVVENILDLNTDPKAKRTITVKIELVPSADRQQIGIQVGATSKLAPVNKLNTALCAIPTTNGELEYVEMIPQVPGQFNLESEVQEQPKLLNLAKRA